MPAEFVENRRRAALEAYEAEPVPTWRRSGFWTTSLRGLDLDALEPKRFDLMLDVNVTGMVAVGLSGSGGGGAAAARGAGERRSR